MATIVQPYNDWREKALVGFLGPIVGNWIQRSQEAEANRKQNAMAAEALRQLGLGNDYPTPNPSIPAANVGSNGWENAFRSGNDNPLAQFDAGTAGIAPNATQVSSATPQNMPTLADIQRVLINLGGTKRFGMVNPEAVQKLLAPYLNAYEANRIEQRKSKLVDTIRAAKNAEERLNNALWPGYIMGDIPIEGVNAGQAQYQYDNPHAVPQMYNAGGSTYAYSFNPRTGEFNLNNGIKFNNGLTPLQVQAGEQFDKTFNEGIRQFNANQGLQTRRQDFIENEAEFKRNHPELKPQYGEDGTLYYVNPFTGEAVYARTQDGNVIKVDHDSYSKYRSNPSSSSSSASSWNQADAAFVRNRQYNINQLRSRRKQIEKFRNEAYNEEQRKKYEDEIATIDAEIQKNQNEIDERIASLSVGIKQNNSQAGSLTTPQNNTQSSPQNNYTPQNSTQNNSQSSNRQYDIHDDFGAMAINGANNGAVSAPFEQKRTRPNGSTYYHHGTDYPAPEGSPVTLTYGNGAMRVAKVANDPNGYGNYVDLEGSFTDSYGQNHSVTIRYAHLKNGSVQVKHGDSLAYGDAIGQVGNTGNSRGKNGGYHLHVETSIDGQLVDPQKFNRILAEHTSRVNYSPSRSQSQPDLDNVKNATVFFRNSQTGETISQYQFEQLLLQGENGEIPNHRDARTPEQVLDLIRSDGFDEDFRPNNYQWISPNGRIVLRNPNNNRVITDREYQQHMERVKNGRLAHLGIHDEAGYLAYMKSKGFEQYHAPDNYNFNPVNTDYTADNNNENNNVGLTPMLTDQERERISTQGSTGSDIARSNENQNLGVLNSEKNMSNNLPNDEFNSEIMWQNPDGRTISASEYNNRLQLSGMDNPDYDAWLESQGFRRADNSYNQAPPITDIVNETTPEAMNRQLASLNDNNNAPEVTGTTFMGEQLPGIQPHGDLSASLTPMGAGNSYNDNEPMTSLMPFVDEQNHNSRMVYDPYAPSYGKSNGQPVYPRSDEYNGWPPDDYSPYDFNYPQPEPYSEDDQYERGFEFDDDSAPEVSGTTFMDQYLPGLENPGALAASKTPMGRGRTKPKAQAKATPKKKNVKKPAAPKANTTQTTARKPGQIKPNTSYENLKNEVDSSAKRHGVDSELVRAIIQVESKWDSNAISKTGAKGLMQLTSQTARGLGVSDPYDPAQNIEGGTKYIAQLIKRYDGDVSKALMAYNCGPANVSRGRVTTATKNYANNVMAIYNRLKSNVQ